MNNFLWFLTGMASLWGLVSILAMYSEWQEIKLRPSFLGNVIMWVGLAIGLGIMAVITS